MKKGFKMRILCTLLLCFSLFTGFASNENPQLTIEIQNIEIVKGNIRIGIFNTSENFLKQGSTFKSYVIAVEGRTETIIINDLPKGEYAFMLYHDKNSDAKLNQNFFGVPKEPFAFSNNVRPKLSKPTFEDCKFLLAKDKILQVNLGYFK